MVGSDLPVVGKLGRGVREVQIKLSIWPVIYGLLLGATFGERGQILCSPNTCQQSLVLAMSLRRDRDPLRADELGRCGRIALRLQIGRR